VSALLRRGFPYGSVSPFSLLPPPTFFFSWPKPLPFFWRRVAARWQGRSHAGTLVQPQSPRFFSFSSPEAKGFFTRGGHPDAPVFRVTADRFFEYERASRTLFLRPTELGPPPVPDD